MQDSTRTCNSILILFIRKTLKNSYTAERKLSDSNNKSWTACKVLNDYKGQLHIYGKENEIKGL